MTPPSERSFGITFAVVFALLAAWFLYAWGMGVGTATLAIASLGFLVASQAAPGVLRPLNLAWFKFGLMLHSVMNPLVLGLLFFVVVMPIGVVMRIFGKDFLGLKRDAASYWIERKPGEAASSSMSNQF